MSGGPPATGLWIEAGLALGLLVLAAMARALALALAARRAAAPGVAAGPEPALAPALTAEILSLALLGPALLLVAEVVRALVPTPGAAFAAAAAAGLVFGLALPARLGAARARRPPRAPGPWLGRFAYPFRPLVAHLVRRRAALPEAEPAADEAKLLGRLLDASAETALESAVETAEVRLLLGRVLHLRETPVTAIMRPRAAIAWVGLRDAVPVAVERMRAGRHSRLPVCGRDLDDVVGVVHLKDLFLVEQGLVAAPNLGAIAREPSIVGPDTTLGTLLAEWRHGYGAMSLVREASGEISGLVTLADVIGWLLAAPEADDPAAPGDLADAGSPGAEA